jgi:hypothetical protein
VTIAQVPSGMDAPDFTGNGTVWFKIFEDQAENGGYELAWPNMSAYNPIHPDVVFAPSLLHVPQDNVKS